MKFSVLEWVLPQVPERKLKQVKYPPFPVMHAPVAGVTPRLHAHTTGRLSSILTISPRACRTHWMLEFVIKLELMLSTQLYIS